MAEEWDTHIYHDVLEPILFDQCKFGGFKVNPSFITQHNFMHGGVGWFLEILKEIAVEVSTVLPELWCQDMGDPASNQ
ncbi:hypothetical protein IWQ62_000533 [Dispira parvispora]|uniref:Uncharacterized protein n=1 Tax=Dispira parvispora TaxID=1520584 RepID=A0A9W8B139_9FUNG|nr:hypothetical protein IWQ62_000533 [Dispira parvispora]